MYICHSLQEIKRFDRAGCERAMLVLGWLKATLSICALAPCSMVCMGFIQVSAFYNVKRMLTLGTAT